MREGSRVRKRERGQRQKGVSSVIAVDGVVCAEGEDALVVVIGIPVLEKNVIAACAGGRWKKSIIGGGLVSLGAGGGLTTFVPEERRRLGVAMRCEKRS